jgi:Sigma-70 region 2
MLGSLSEVDDAVQEAWLRLSRTDATGIDNLGGWLTTVVARVCLDMLRSRQSRREEPFTPDAPEPVATGTRGSSPEQEALLADSVGLALLIVLDRLTPVCQARRPRSAARRSGQGGPSPMGTMARGVQPALVNGAIGLVMAPRGRLSRALTFTIANGKVTEIEVIGDPARLGELDVSIVD